MEEGKASGCHSLKSSFKQEESFFLSGGLEEGQASGGKSLKSLLARGQVLQDGLRDWGGIGSARLQKLVRAELSFLTRLSRLSADCIPASIALRSTNFDHVEDVFKILQHPLVSGVSAVMQNFAVGGPTTSPRTSSPKDTVHVDIACLLDGKPVWLIISSRNRRYNRWLDTNTHVKGLRNRVEQLLRAACADPVKQPESILLCFTGGVEEDVDRGLRDEFSAIHGASFNHTRPSSSSALRDSSMDSCNTQLECDYFEVEGGEWLHVEVEKDASLWNGARENGAWETYEVNSWFFERRTRDEVPAERHTDVDSAKDLVARQKGYARENDIAICCSSAFPSSLSCGGVGDRQSNLKRSVQLSADQISGSSTADESQNWVNLDTTALVALVSEVSNGGAKLLLALPRGEMEKRFPSMSAFIREQALSELERPLAPEIEDAMGCRQPVVSHYVYDEFTSIVAHSGGAKETDRARKLLQRVRIMPDTPSNRVMSLPLSGRIKRRHKIVFGTGDFLKAPTLTANMAFVRAAKEKGMPIAILEHRPRALTGD